MDKVGENARRAAGYLNDDLRGNPMSRVRARIDDLRSLDCRCLAGSLYEGRDCQGSWGRPVPRCSLPGPLPGLPRRVPLRRPELAGQLPVGGWCCQAADSSALELGELGVSDDRRGPDHPGAAMGGALRPAGRRRGGAGRARHRAGTEASGQRLGTVPRRDHRLRRGGRFIRGEVARRLGLQRAHHAGYAPAGPR